MSPSDNLYSKLGASALQDVPVKSNGLPGGQCQSYFVSLREKVLILPDSVSQIPRDARIQDEVMQEEAVTCRRVQQFHHTSASIIIHHISLHHNHHQPSYLLSSSLSATLASNIILIIHQVSLHHHNYHPRQPPLS